MKVNRMPTFGVEINAGLIKLKFDDLKVKDISYYFGRKKTVAGPFLIIERKSGLALETSSKAEFGQGPVLAPVSGNIEQQWILKRVPSKSERLIIISAVNNMVLDKTDKCSTLVPFVLSKVVLNKENGHHWQWWTISPTADGIGWVICSCSDPLILPALDVGKEPTVGQGIWTWDKHELTHQQFLI